MSDLLLTSCIAFKKSPENVVPMNSLLNNYSEASSYRQQFEAIV